MFSEHRFLMIGHDKTGFKNQLYLDGLNGFIRINKKVEEE